MGMILQHVWASIFGRCPRCFKGKVFDTFFGMHENCPACNLHYERETGYFLMSIFFAYLIDGLVLIPLGIWMFQHRVDTLPAISILMLLLIIVTPLSFRYSRITWLHVDHILDPLKRQ